MKSLYLILFVIMLFAAGTGMPILIQGIAERGWDGVNYGRVVFPLLLSVLTFWLYRKQKKQ